MENNTATLQKRLELSCPSSQKCQSESDRFGPKFPVGVANVTTPDTFFEANNNHKMPSLLQRQLDFWQIAGW